MTPARFFAQPSAVAPQSALDHGGEGAAAIGNLWNLMLVLGIVTTALVIAVMAIALFRRRHASELPPEADRPADPRGEHANVEDGGRGHEGEGRPRSERLGVRWMVAGGVVLPAVVLTVLLVHSLRALDSLSPGTRPETLIIEVTGRQWWWRVKYLAGNTQSFVETANEIRIPVGPRVRVVLKSSDVIHSFWVPGLQGKTDMIPGRTNVTWLQADRPGTWRGQCAEFCGLQHAKMAMVVVAEPPEKFRSWLLAQRRPALEPSDSITLAGRDAFLSSGCVMCHSIRGTPARGSAGPDLTHVGSRVTLAAGELPNTHGHLYGWIANPQAIKPGSRMPAVPASPHELQSIARYLMMLR